MHTVCKHRKGITLNRLLKNGEGKKFQIVFKTFSLCVVITQLLKTPTFWVKLSNILNPTLKMKKVKFYFLVDIYAGSISDNVDF